MSHIRFGCPTCRQVLQVTADRAGVLVDCPSCKTRLRVPAPAPPAAPPQPEPLRLEPAGEPEVDDLDVVEEPELPAVQPVEEEEPARATTPADEPPRRRRDPDADLDPDDLPPPAGMERDIGDILDEFALGSRVKTRRIVFLCIGGAVALLGMTCMVPGILAAPRSSGPLLQSFVCSGLFVGIGGIVAVAGWFWAGATPPWKLWLCLYGLGYRFGTRRAGYCRYEEVVSCTSTRHTTVYKRQGLLGAYETGRRTVLTFNVELPDGERLTLSNTKHGQRGVEAGERIGKETLRAVLADCRRRIQQGKTVRLGPYRLSPRGLELGSRLVHWDDIDEVKLVDNAFRVLGDRRRLLPAVPMMDLPHPGVFYALAQDFLPRRRGREDDNPFAF